MELKEEIKRLLVTELKLENTKVEDIADDAPIFGEGLGLDSLDAVELVVVLKRKFGIDMGNMEEARKAFSSINALAEYVQQHTAAK